MVAGQPLNSPKLQTFEILQSDALNGTREPALCPLISYSHGPFLPIFGSQSLRQSRIRFMYAPKFAISKEKTMPRVQANTFYRLRPFFPGNYLRCVRKLAIPLIFWRKASSGKFSPLTLT